MRFLPAHETNYAVGRGRAVDCLVIHYTAGDGDTAEANARHFQKPGLGASAHYFVDEREIVQSVKEADRAWHAGQKAMNDRSIGIEMCSRKGRDGQYYIPAATVENAQTLCRELMAKYKIPAENVIRHFDVTGKRCPEPFVRKPELWKAFRAGLAVPSKTSRQIVQEAAGLSDGTMDYLAAYRWGKDLLDKLAAAVK